tara:strand:- start:1786 stop:2454 length:669 start_codon:yes stop_codon:yes gene_type:complete
MNQGDLRQVFPTVMMQRTLPDVQQLNDRLRDIVLERERISDGLTASNVGGWHSSADLLEWAEPEVRVLETAIMEAGRDMTASMLPPGIEGEIDVKLFGGCWANVIRDGGYNKIHNHPGAVWSGCYYVCIGEPEPEPDFNGWIEFQDPRPGNLHGGKERICPESGLLLLWPGWLNHFVNPFIGKGERISIAFNLEAEVVAAKPAAPKPAPASIRQAVAATVAR